MRKRSLGFVVGGLLVALLLAGVVSNYASSHPDGLDSSLREGCTFDADDNITGGDCPARQEREHELADSPLADYGLRGVDNGFLSTGLSGVLGVLLTFAVGAGGFWLLRRRAPRPGDDEAVGHRPGDDEAADHRPGDHGRTGRDRTTGEHPTHTGGDDRAAGRSGASATGPVG